MMKKALVLVWFVLGLACGALAWQFYQTNMPLIQTNASGQIISQAPQIAPKPSIVHTPPAIVRAPAGAVLSYHDAVAAAAPSVVNIYTTQNVASYDDPFGQGGGSNLGSGVVVSKDGFVLTNAHVIDKASEIIVAFSDGQKAHAKVVGADSESDLAVIKVDLDNLVPIKFRSEPVLVGDVALAIGNPFGVGQTVTQGIISATGRSGLGVSTFEDFVQTDAAINPGNSGGALVDSSGALIGINTVIFSRSGGSQGVGFAIPTSIVEQVMNALIKDGRVSRGWLGIEIAGLDNPADTAPDRVVVARVMADTPASEAGLQAGDEIIRLDDTPIATPQALLQYIGRKAPKQVVNATIKRGDSVLTLPIMLAERPRARVAQNPHQNLSDEQREALERMLKEYFAR